MINTINNQFLTKIERERILQRALLSQPFFNLISFGAVAGVRQVVRYAEKADVNQDFWITEIVGNFGETFNTLNSLFDVSVYSQQNKKSLYRYSASQKIPSGFVMSEARFNDDITTQKFCDLQNEYLPRLIKTGDEIITSVQNVGAQTDVYTIRVVLKGFYANTNEYLVNTSQDGIKEALKKDNIEFETWRVTVNNAGLANYKFENDRKARLVLGFAVVEKATNPSVNSLSLVTITDNFRDSKWNNEPMPIEFLAPRTPIVKDTPYYYLPVEYFFAPFSSLNFKIDNTLNGGNGYELVMLTRTV